MSDDVLIEIRKEVIKEAVRNLDNPWDMLTVKDVARDLFLGEGKANEIFNRKDFPSINIGKKRKVQKLAYILWKMEKRVEV